MSRNGRFNETDEEVVADLPLHVSCGVSTAGGCGVGYFVFLRGNGSLHTITARNVYPLGDR